MPWDFCLIFLALAVFVPWRGRIRLREFLAIPQVGSRERISLYLSTIAFQWLAVAITAWRASARGLTGAQMALVVNARASIYVAAIVGAAILASLQWLNLRRMGKMTVPVRGFQQKLIERILPRSRRELIPYLALAITAGFCEEFLYRGFAMAAIGRTGLPTWLVVLTSSALFGLAHLYQGRGGLIGTLLIGLFFGTARVVYGSLVPVILWHAAVDAVAGIAGPRYLKPSRNPTRNVERT